MSKKDTIRDILGFNKKAEKIKTGEKKETLLQQLFKRPQKNKGVDIRHYNKPLSEGIQQQGDLLFLPTDAFGYKYALVIADISTNRCDAEPLKDKTNQAVLTGIKKIYARGILKKPTEIRFDAGSEFKGSVAQFFKENGIVVKVSATNVHSQTAIVEYINKLLGKVIGQLQVETELEKNKTSKEWVKYLAEIVDVINEKADINRDKNKAKAKNYESSLHDDVITNPKQIKETVSEFVENIKNDASSKVPVVKTDVPLAGKVGKDILNEGDKVRVALDYPIDVVSGKRLHGTFRAGDIRWTKEIHTIDKVLMQPNQPVAYLVSGITNRSFTRNQLQAL